VPRRRCGRSVVDVDVAGSGVVLAKLPLPRLRTLLLLLLASMGSVVGGRRCRGARNVGACVLLVVVVAVATNPLPRCPTVRVAAVLVAAAAAAAAAVVVDVNVVAVTASSVITIKCKVNDVICKKYNNKINK